MRIMRKYLIVAMLLCLMPLSVAAEQVTVAAAANLQPLMPDLQSAFEQASSSKLKVIIGSSGKFTTQIENGAPFDVFLSADMKYPQTLYKESLATAEPKAYAYGTLILWSMKDLNFGRGPDILKDASIRKIAIADPRLAPYGREAVNALKGAGIYEAVNGKIVYGENIAQTNTFVTTGAADIGMTSKSTVFDPALKNKGFWVEVPVGSYNRISQGAVVLKHGAQSPASQEFYKFLFSADAKTIFKKYGYRVDE